MFQLKVLALLLALFTAVLAATAEAGGHGSAYGRYAECSVRRAWVPGHFSEVQRAVWVPGSTQRLWVPAALETRYDACGQARRVLVRDGYWQLVASPGRYEQRPTRVWVSGRWSVSRR